ncbi:MAG: PQQ-binding-like beta-propeller repeat protein [Actinomycetota bacterium]
MKTRLIAVLSALVVVLIGPGSGAVPQSSDAVREVPVQAGSPWPSMRHDRRNTGRSSIRARYEDGDAPWAFQTGKGIFSVPVIDADGTAYFGSADRNFYAVDSQGHEAWRFQTGEVIDSAAVLGAYDEELGTSPVTFGSGDSHVYHLRTGEVTGDREVWKFKATAPPGAGQQVTWWEGNVVMGFDGEFYAGNTGGSMYALNPDGTLRWSYPTDNAIWTAAAIGNDGTTYWGSLDMSVYALDKDGKLVWRLPTLGFVASSIVLGNDGTAYVGSFDSKFYALDAATGVPKWTFQTSDHIYSSAALLEDDAGNTTAIYIASADGSVYALSPSGALLWRYDTGDVVRSSPSIGRAPDGDGNIVYIGSSNGKLYALDAQTGRRRWSYDATPDDPILRDRNDMNGAPALGATGIYATGEHGYLVYVPYDYCLHATDARCSTDPGDEFGNDVVRTYFVTPGGSTLPGDPTDSPAPATVINARLVVREGGETVDASMLAAPPALSGESLVSTFPAFDFTAQISGDGHFVHIAPNGFLAPDTEYSVRIGGNYTTGGLPVGNYVVGGTTVSPFNDVIRFRTAASAGSLPLSVGTNSVSAFDIRRLAVPMPPLIPSVNQIGFDSYDWIAGVLDIGPPNAAGEGNLLMWVVGTKHVGGQAVVDPNAYFSFPLAGRYKDDFVILNQRNLTLPFSFGDVPMRRFELRGQLGQDLRVRSGASLYAEVTCADVPFYGPLLYVTGLCNTEGTLPASGTFITDAYNPNGAANKRPEGLSVSRMTIQRPTLVQEGVVSAKLVLAPGASYPANSHVVSVVLADAATGEMVSMAYKENLRVIAGDDGNVSEVRLTLPAGTTLPSWVKAYVVTDVFPLYSRLL